MKIQTAECRVCTYLEFKKYRFAKYRLATHNQRYLSQPALPKLVTFVLCNIVSKNTSKIGIWHSKVRQPKCHYSMPNDYVSQSQKNRILCKV